MLHAKKSFWGKRPGFDSGDVFYVSANLGFVAVLYAMILYWHLVPIAILLVLLSKWRILAVQPRFWFPNIRANLVDITVGMSTVGLVSQAKNSWVALICMFFYVIWLLGVKPREGDVWVGVQSLWAQFLGLTVLFMIPSFVKQPLMVVVFAWLISWAAAKHFFSNYEEPHYRLLSMVWSFLIAQLVWISLHWLQYYNIATLQIGVCALIIVVLAASFGSLYHAYKKDHLHRGALLENGIFAIALIAIILATSGWSARL